MKNPTNYPSENRTDHRIRIILGKMEEDCMKELARLWRKRDGSEMRYTDIVRLALFNLASESGVDTLPYLGLIHNALKDVCLNYDALARVRREYKDQLAACPELQELEAALERLQDCTDELADEVRRKALAGNGCADVSEEEED